MLDGLSTIEDERVEPWKSQPTWVLRDVKSCRTC